MSRSGLVPHSGLLTSVSEQMRWNSRSVTWASGSANGSASHFDYNAETAGTWEHR